MQGAIFCQKLLTSFFLLVVGIGGLSAQDWLIRHYTIDDGLPHNIGYDLLQDNDGFMWIGLDNGLARFDGREFLHIEEEAGLGSPYIITLSRGRQGEIYCSAYRNQVSKVEKNKISFAFPGRSPRFRSHLFHPRLHFFRDEVFLLEYRKDLNQNVFIHYKDSIGIESKIEQTVKGLELVRGISKSEWTQNYRNSYKLAELNPLNPIRAYVTPKEEMFWTTQTGFYQYLGDGAFKTLSQGHFERIDGTSDGKVYLAATGAFYCWDGKRLELMYQSPKINCHQFKVSDQGVIMWVNKNDYSLWAFDIHTQKLARLDEQVNSPAAFSFLQKDLAGNFWLTTNGGGLFYLQHSKVENLSKTLDTRKRFVKSIAGGLKDEIWLGTTQGLVCLKQQAHKWQESYVKNEVAPFINKEVRKVRFYSPSRQYAAPRIVVSAITGNWELNLSTYQWTKRFFSLSSNLGYDSTGCIYISEIDGISINPEGEQLLRIDFASLKNFRMTGDFSDIVAKNPQDIWYASPYLLHHIEDEKVTKYAIKEGLPDSTIYDLAYDHESTLWVSTKKGLAYWDGDMFIPHPLNHKVKDKGHKMVFEKNGAIWLGGPKGVFRLLDDQILHFNRRLGLPSNDITDLFLDYQNRLWIATSEGLCVIKDLAPIDLKPPPPVILEDFVVNATYQDSAMASYSSDADISFNIRLIEYTTPDALQLEFRLKKDAPWVPTQNLEFSFSSLQPDIYSIQFRAKALNSNWSAPLTIPFEILPPWWQRWWAIAGMTVLFLLVSGWIIRARIRSIREKATAQNELNQQMAHLQLSALQTQLNPHFLFNALNAIQYFILNKDEITANDYLSKFSRLMRLYLEASNTRYIPLTEELELLELYIELERLRFEGHFDYEIHIDQNLDLDNIELPSMLLQPFVENAINHGLRHKKETGLLKITFSEEEDMFSCSIEDNGVGRAAAKILREQLKKGHKSRGMQLLEDRVKLLNTLDNSEISILTVDLFDEKQQPCGTRVEIRHPI